jgi:hypothetical protein
MFFLHLASQELRKQFIIFNQNLNSCKRLKNVTYLSDRGGMHDITKQCTDFYFPLVLQNFKNTMKLS